MKWRLSYGSEHPGVGNSQILVIKDQNYGEGTRDDVGRISDAVLTELAGYKISFVQ